MQTSHAKTLVKQTLKRAGIGVNGDAPWDIRVHHPGFYDRVLAGWSLALGESYMDGWWDCERLDCFFHRLLSARIDKHPAKPDLRMIWETVKAKIVNRQRKTKAFEVGKKHYDIGNDLFSAMLDKRMNYSCAYWRNGQDSLENAQEAKLNLICRKLDLKPGMSVLDIGCGWGGFSKYVAKVYGAKVTGITVSRRQAAFAQNHCHGYDVAVKLQDYRDLDEKFDRIVSVGMFEHVGAKNYRNYMETIRKCMAGEALFLLQTIGGNTSAHHTDPWMEKYIFPNGVLPSAGQIAEAAEGRLVLEDWRNFGQDYDKTLMVWHQNFVSNWEALKHKYDDRFFRMWTYYLLACAGAFRAGRNRLWQIVFSKNGLKDGYRPVV